MNMNQLSPYIRVALDSRLASGWVVRERDLFDYELLYVKEGEIRVTADGTVYNGKPGDLFLFRPGQRHSIASVGKTPVRQPHIHFDLIYAPDSPDVKVSFKRAEEMSAQEKLWFRDDLISGQLFDIPVFIRLRNPSVAENMLMDLIRDFSLNLPYAQLNAKGAFIQLWVYLLRELEWARNTHIRAHWERLTKVKLYLDHHLDENITLGALAEMAELSPYYFLRTFTKAFGVSPLKYHQAARIAKAREWIQFTSLPLTEIAERVGFQSIHAFSRAFKQKEGVPPSFYRNDK